MNINQNPYRVGVEYYPEYSKNYGKSHAESEATTSFEDRLGEGQRAVDESAKAGEDEKDTKQDDATESKTYREQILEKMEEMAQNIKKGTIQPKFKIGAQEYTVKEWEKLLEKIDSAEEALREEVEAMIEEVKKQAAAESLRREAESGMHDPERATYVSETTRTQTTSDVTDVPGQPAAGVAGTDTTKTDEIGAEKAAALLTDEITKCSYPTDDPEHKHCILPVMGRTVSPAKKLIMTEQDG